MKNQQIRKNFPGLFFCVNPWPQITIAAFAAFIPLK